MKKDFEVIIIGGSYAGLQAGMTLGRSLRNVLIIDSGLPCNRQTPHSHNFLTRDGEKPATIAGIAKEQLTAYTTVQIHTGKAISGAQTENGFSITTEAGETFTARRLFFGTGIKDIFPAIPGLAECWGISVIHCPYCHGYEVRGQVTGILANGDMAFEFAKMISHWTDSLTIFTNGTSTLTAEQMELLNNKKIPVIDTPLKEIIHQDGYLKEIWLENGTRYELKALYAKLPFEQHCDIPAQLGCEINEMGFIKVDEMGKTTIPGISAAGDCTSMMRSVGNAVGTAMSTAAMINREMIMEDF